MRFGAPEPPGLGRETLMEELTMASLLFRPLNTGLFV